MILPEVKKQQESVSVDLSDIEGKLSKKTDIFLDMMADLENKIYSTNKSIMGMFESFFSSMSNQFIEKLSIFDSNDDKEESNNILDSISHLIKLLTNIFDKITGTTQDAIETSLDKFNKFFTTNTDMNNVLRDEQEEIVNNTQDTSTTLQDIFDLLKSFIKDQNEDDKNEESRRRNDNDKQRVQGKTSQFLKNQFRNFGDLASLMMAPESFIRVYGMKLISSIFGSIGGGIGKLIDLMFTTLPGKIMLPLITGLTLSIKDGIAGYLKSDDFNTSKISAMIGSMIGGASSGYTNILTNSLKLAGIGTGVGALVGGPVGAITGAIVGAVLGAIAGAIGPKEISQWADDTMHDMLMLSRKFRWSFTADVKDDMEERIKRFSEQKDIYAEDWKKSTQKIDALNQELSQLELSKNTLTAEQYNLEKSRIIAEIADEKSRQSSLLSDIERNSELLTKSKQDLEDVQNNNFTIWQKVKNTTNAMWERTKQFFNDVLEMISTTYDKILDSITSSISDYVASTINYFTGADDTNLQNSINNQNMASRQNNISPPIAIPNIPKKLLELNTAGVTNNTQQKQPVIISAPTNSSVVSNQSTANIVSTPSAKDPYAQMIMNNQLIGAGGW